jgi:hypothetical protein
MIWMNLSELCWIKNKKKGERKNRKKTGPIPNIHILYDFIGRSFLKWQNYRNEEQISGHQELREVDKIIKGQ